MQCECAKDDWYGCGEGLMDSDKDIYLVITDSTKTHAQHAQVLCATCLGTWKRDRPEMQHSRFYRIGDDVTDHVKKYVLTQ